MTLTDVYEKLWEGIELSTGAFFAPNKRIYFIFLFTSLLLAYYVYSSKRIRGSFVKYVFNPKIWLGPSPRVDYIFLIFNGVFKVLAIAPLLIGSLYLSFYVKELLLNQWGYLEIKISSFWIISLYTLSLFVLKDFSSYVVHWLFHKVPILWRFHKVHHSATVLNPITQYRIHPVELWINNLKGIIVFGWVTGFFDFLSNGNFSVYSILGVNIFGFLFMALGANLRHSHVKLRYPGWVENYLISPVQHQIHHSDNPSHFDRNLGSVLAIWDKAFGTLLKSEQTQRIRFGLGENKNQEHQTFWQNLFPKK